MTQRLDYFSAAPTAMEILLEQENYFRRQFRDDHRVTVTVWELVKLRISQINQCAFCIDMHSKDALKYRESMERIYSLSAWRDAHCYTSTERLALEWAELITSNRIVGDDSYQRALACFGEQGLVDLTIAINAINSWNRIAKAFKPEVGSYQPN